MSFANNSGGCDDSHDLAEITVDAEMIAYSGIFDNARAIATALWV
ncbi:hypothetical protein AB4Y45_45925 [Paraburkholderia sp. EG287A]